MLTPTKPVNLGQLQTEMETASIDIGKGLGMTDVIFRYVGGGPGLEGAPAEPSDFADESAAQAVFDDHIAMRNKTDAEYSAEFQNPETTPERKQEIRDITAGLLPREQVPMTQEEWDKMRGTTV